MNCEKKRGLYLQEGDVNYHKKDVIDFGRYCDYIEKEMDFCQLPTCDKMRCVLFFTIQYVLFDGQRVGALDTGLRSAM